MLLSNLFFIWIPYAIFDIPQASAGHQSSPSWIFKSRVPVLRLLVTISDVCSPNTKAIDKNYDVHEDYKNSKIQEGEDVDVPRSPDTPWTFPDVMITFPPNCWCFWKEESFISRNWSDLTPLKCVSLTPGIQKQWFWWRNVENGDNVKIGDNRESSVSDIMMLMTKSYRRFVAWR